MTTSVSAGWSAWLSHVPDSASRGAPTGITLVTAPASLSAAPSTASTDSSAPTAPVTKFSPRAISTSQVRGSHHSVCHVEIVHYASRMSPPATLLTWFQLRSPELAEDFERLMTEDRDIVRGSLDTVSNWRLMRPADVPGQSIGQADYVLIAEIVEAERFEQQASEHVQRLADDLAHLVASRDAERRHSAGQRISGLRRRRTARPRYSFRLVASLLLPLGCERAETETPA